MTTAFVKGKPVYFFHKQDFLDCIKENMGNDFWDVFNEAFPDIIEMEDEIGLLRCDVEALEDESYEYERQCFALEDEVRLLKEKLGKE